MAPSWHPLRAPRRARAADRPDGLASSVGTVGGTDNGENRRFITWVIAIAIGGLAIRVAYVLLFRTQQLPLPFYDSLIFHLGGNDLAQGRGFVDAFTGQQTAAHPPLYLLWLGIISYVSPGHSATPTTHMLWSCLLGVGTVTLCGLTGREIAGRRVGITAAVLAARVPEPVGQRQPAHVRGHGHALRRRRPVLRVPLHPPTEPVARGVARVALRPGARSSRSELVAHGALAARRAGAKPGIPWPRRFQWVIVGGVVSALVIAPWVGYNLSRFDKPVYLSAQLGGTVVAANCPSTYYGQYLGFKDYACQGAAAKQASEDEPELQPASPPRTRTPSSARSGTST